MNSDKIVKAWKSGSVRGYNGDGIRVTATYRIAAPDVAPRAVDIRFYDNSERPGGPTCRLRSFPVVGLGWVEIPLPDADGKFGEGVNLGFTIQGEVRLVEREVGPLLQVRFRWGDEQVHAEEGCIFALDVDSDD